MNVFDVMTSGSAQTDNRAIDIFGVRVDNIVSEDALECIRQYVTHGNGRRAHIVFFTNVHSIHLARRDPQFRRCLDQADLVLPDGSGLMLAGNFFGIPIAENVNGTDFTPKLLRQAEINGWSVYLLGSRMDVIERCYRRLLVKFPQLNIVGYHHGHFGLDEEEAIVNVINEKRPRILLVGLGSPYQEEWIDRHAHHLNVRVCLAVGGLFDFLSASIPRAPLWMRRLGIEWVYRFFQDPKTKWERVFIEIPKFLLMLLVGKLAPRHLHPVSMRGRTTS